MTGLQTLTEKGLHWLEYEAEKEKPGQFQFLCNGAPAKLRDHCMASFRNKY